MHCITARELISASLSGGLPPERGVDLDRHVSTCVACAEVLRADTAVRDLLSTLDGGPRAPPDLLPGLLRHLDARTERAHVGWADRPASGLTPYGPTRGASGALVDRPRAALALDAWVAVGAAAGLALGLFLARDLFQPVPAPERQLLAVAFAGFNAGGR